MGVENSKAHVRAFRRRERQNVDRLRDELGSENVAKLDRQLMRDIIYEKKELEIDAELGAGPIKKAQRYRLSK